MLTPKNNKTIGRAVDCKNVKQLIFTGNFIQTSLYDSSNQSLFKSFKPVSQSCASAKSEISWWATGQSNLADRMAKTAPLAKMELHKYEIQSFSCVQLFVSQNVSLLHVATIQN